MSYPVDPEKEEEALFTFEEAEAISTECWPKEPVVFALRTTEFFGHTKEEFEEAEVEVQRKRRKKPKPKSVAVA